MDRTPWQPWSCIPTTRVDGSICWRPVNQECWRSRSLLPIYSWPVPMVSAPSWVWSMPSRQCRNRSLWPLFIHWSLHLEWSSALCATCWNFVFLQVTAQDSPFLCLLLLTLPTVSSLPQVKCVCVCVLGGWGGGGRVGDVFVYINIMCFNVSCLTWVWNGHI